MTNDKVVIYKTEDCQTSIGVKIENDNVWLTQSQLQELFS